MNWKYFTYAVVLTLVTTVMSWGSMIGSKSSSSGRGSTWSSHSGGGGFGGGGHK